MLKHQRAEDGRDEKKRAFLRRLVFSFVRLVPAIGFELMTYRLQGGCSTN